jgi:hypothetical protein
MGNGKTSTLQFEDYPLTKLPNYSILYAVSTANLLDIELFRMQQRI